MSQFSSSSISAALETPEAAESDIHMLLFIYTSNTEEKSYIRKQEEEKNVAYVLGKAGGRARLTPALTFRSVASFLMSRC